MKILDIIRKNIILNNFFNSIEEFIQNSSDNLFEQILKQISNERSDDNSEFSFLFTIPFNDVFNIISTFYIHEQNKADGNIKILEIFFEHKKKFHNRKIKKIQKKFKIVLIIGFPLRIFKKYTEIARKI
jgi:hypothetical protein